MTDGNQRTVVDRLRKLIAMEQSARKIGNQEEAEAFAAKVAEQLLRHKLERSDVECEAQTAEPVAETRVSAEEIGFDKQAKGSAPSWMTAIASGCAKATGCGLLWNVAANNSAVFCGKLADREAAKELYLHFAGLALTFAWKEGQQAKPRIIAHCKAEWGEGCFGRQSQAMKEFRASYCEGFGAAVGARLAATAKKVMEEAEQSTAMVWVKKDAIAVQTYMTRFTGEAKVKSEFNRHNTEAYWKGRDRGEDVALTAKTFGRTK